MQPQPKQNFAGQTLFEWFVYTNKGRKRTWKLSAADAKKSAEAKGFKVSKVKPATPVPLNLI